MNKTNLIGRITKDPELKDISKDSCVLRFTLAVDDGKYNGEKRTQFITCVAWNAIAEIISKYVKKGEMLAVSGKLQENNYKDKDGVMNYNTEVYVTDVDLLPNGEKKEKAKEEAKEEETEEKKSYSKYSRNSR